MTLAAFTVEYSTDGSTWTALSNVTALSITQGRQKLQDTFQPSNASITIRYPNGYASPITALVVGTFVRVKRVGMSAIYNYIWIGTIRDVVAEYGIPYENNVGNADYLTIAAEGSLALAGRSQGNDYAIAAGPADTQLDDAKDASGVQFEWEYSYGSITQLSASTVSGSYAEWVNTLAASIGAQVYDGGGFNNVVVRPRDYNANVTVGFSDTANNSTNQIYDVIRFDSLADDFYTQVEVNTSGYGTVVVNDGVEPYRTLRLSTFNNSTGQATDLGQYLLGIYGTASFGISEISCLAEAQASMNLELGTFWWGLLGVNTTVAFRGTTYYVTVIGASITATPATTRYTYYLADTDLTPYEVLDDPVRGLFDTRKLGW